MMRSMEPGNEAAHHNTRMQCLQPGAASYPQPALLPPLRRRVGPRQLRRLDQRCVTAGTLQGRPALHSIAMPGSRVALCRAAGCGRHAFGRGRGRGRRGGAPRRHVGGGQAMQAGPQRKHQVVDPGLIRAGVA